MKKFIAFITAALCIALFVGCGKEKTADKSVITKDRIFVSFEEAVQQSTNIVEATYANIIEKNGEIEYVFNVKKQLKGETGSETVCIHLPDGKKISLSDHNPTYFNQNFTKNKDYLLILNRNISVYNEHEEYSQILDEYIPLDNLESAQIYHSKIEEDYISDKSVFESVETLESHIEQIISECDTPAKEYLGRDYIKSDDIVEIAKGSEYIAAVTPIWMEPISSYPGTNIYKCRIDGVYKGDINTSETYILFFSGSVELEKSYTVALSGDSPDIVLVLSSKNSLCTTEEQAEQMINAVKG